MRTSTAWAFCGCFLAVALQGCKAPAVPNTQPRIPSAEETTVSKQEERAPTPARTQRRKYLHVTCPADWMAKEGMPLYAFHEHDRFLNDLPKLDGETVLLQFYGEITTCGFADGDCSTELYSNWTGWSSDRKAPILAPQAEGHGTFSLEFKDLRRYSTSGLHKCQRFVYGTGREYWSMAVKVELATQAEQRTIFIRPQ